MGRPDGRIEKGQRLGSAISARAWNRAQDAADVVLGATPGLIGAGSSGIDYPLARLRIENSLGRNLSRFECVYVSWIFGATPPHTDPEQDHKDTRNFLSNPVFRVVTSFGNSYGSNGLGAGKLGCCIEPINNSSVGLVAVSGIVPVKVKLSEETWKSSQMAMPVAIQGGGGSPRIELWQNPVCGFKIVYIPRDTGTQWCLVDLSSWCAEPIVYAISNSSTTARIFFFSGDSRNLGNLQDTKINVTLRPDNIYKEQGLSGLTEGTPVKMWLRNPLASSEYFATSSDNGSTLTFLPGAWDVVSIESDKVILTKQFTTINGIQVVSDISANKEFPLNFRTPKVS